MHSAQLVPKHTAYRSVMQWAYAENMQSPSLRQRRRTAQLQRLVDLHTASVLAAYIGTPKSHISAILAGRRGVGDELAAKIERKYDMPPGALDSADDLVLSDAERAIVMAVRRELQQPRLADPVANMKATLDRRAPAPAVRVFTGTDRRRKA